MDDLKIDDPDRQAMLAKGEKLLADVMEARQKLDSLQDAWKEHVQEQFAPETAMSRDRSMAVDPPLMSDPHIAAHYEPSPQEAAAQFKSVAAAKSAAKKSQEREQWQTLRRTITAPEAAEEQAGPPAPPITQAVTPPPKESSMENENQAAAPQASPDVKPAAQEAELQFPHSPFPPFDPAEHARVQSEALRVIIASTESMLAVRRGAVPLDIAQQVVAADLAALNLISDREFRHTALLLMHESMVGQVQYQVALSRQDPQVWMESHAAAAEQSLVKNTPLAAPEVLSVEKPVEAVDPAALQPPTSDATANVAADERRDEQVRLFYGAVGLAQVAMSAPTDAVAPDEAKLMVADHLDALSQIDDGQMRKFTVMAIWESANAQQHYSAELAKQSPELFAAYSSLDNEAAPAAAPAAQAKPDMIIDAAALAQLADARAKDRQAVEKSRNWNTIERGDSAERTPAVTLEKPAVAAQAPAAAPVADRSLTAVPPEVERAYLHVENKFYMTNNKKHVAFEDGGAKLQTALDDDKVVLSMVQIAHARGWTEIKVSGHGDFPRKAWRDAALLGMTVKGYTPTDLDKADLARRMPAKPENVVASTPASQAGIYINAEDAALLVAAKAMRKAAAAPAPAALAVAATPAPVAAVAPTAAAAPVAAKPAGDTLVAHGPAKYLNDPTNSKSYFVTLENEKGNQRTIWGTGLQEAIAKSGVKVGEQIELEKNGQKQVEVDANIKNAAGTAVVGTEKIGAVRNEWVVKAAAFANQAPADAVKAHPDLAGAIGKAAAIDKQAEADGFTPAAREIISQRVKQNIANSIERGDPHPVKLRESVEVQAQPQSQPQAQQAQMQ